MLCPLILPRRVFLIRRIIQDKLKKNKSLVLLNLNMSSNPQVNGTKKGKTLEDIYKKKTQLEHILLRPDTYIGSVEKVTESTWVFEKESETIINKPVTYVPGLYKIYDEILVNAADHKHRDGKMDTIKIDIDQEENLISIWNNGKGIPVANHKEEKMFIPTMIFGHLLTSSNYDDDEKKVTGGRNGYGAKLCNIFSKKFTVETISKEYKKSFKQVWGSNMSKTSEPKIKENSGSEFTKITFSPDLDKFHMDTLDDDIVGIMSRRAYDIAASARGVKVFLNGKRIPIKTFKDYVDLYIKDKTDDSGNQLKCVYESVNPRWEIAITTSDTGLQHMSFVNSIATTKGGRHVDYVVDHITKNLTETLKKKNKSGMIIKPFQVKQHMWVFVNCLIENPTFDSQTKETMTLQSKNFGSKCIPSDKFINGVIKGGIVDAVMMMARFKQQQQLQGKCTVKKQNKIKGIPKLEDANDAGTRHSSDCTLILTEGDSAKTLAVAGFSVVGRDRYGVFPLKGKLLNVREASHKQILENAEINNIIKILGLQYKKKYDSQDDVKTLRYGKLMIMTDQDQDGSHIKGLLINFFHHNWPTLLRQNFLEEFITPIVKATKGKEECCFYSLPEFEEWKSSKNNWHTYKIKYYKGLGTSTSKEAKEYFNDMDRHRILFEHGGNQDDQSIRMAFSKKEVDQRKEWLTAHMGECKRRKELGLPDNYLYEKNTKKINYSDFINKELVLFSNYDNERSIPSLVDGLKPGQRKVLYTCMKRADKKEVKVAQLAGSVAEYSAYHHGEASLMSTIINLAHNFVGSNNINLLKPVGQFGTRLQGGKDAASPRYIFTQLSKLTRFLFHVNDEAVLKFLRDDSQRIEPEWYIPIIPMVLVNGCEGIGTGWSTKVHNYNPREIVRNLKRMMRGEDPKHMKPWYKNFRGTIEELDPQKYVLNGEVGRLSHNKYEIFELPIKTWTQPYKESVMETLLQGTEKHPALISDYREYHTDVTVRFVVTLPEDKVYKVEEVGAHKIFKLQTTTSLASMVLFDHNGCLKKYESAIEILQEFYDLRLKYYGKRKAYMVGFLEAEANKLSNQARFILEKCDGRLTVENKKRKLIIEELHRKGFDSDPLKTWKGAYDKEALIDEEKEANENLEEEVGAVGGNDYDYLMGMAMWKLTMEEKEKMLKNRDEKVHELNTLKKKSPMDIWTEDLDAFIKELDIVEQQEREDDLSEQKKKSATKSTGGAKRKKVLAVEVMPSSRADRIVPVIDAELKKKVEKAAQAKENKGKKIKKEVNAVEVDEFDEMLDTSTGKSLSARLGNSPSKIEKIGEKKLKQAKLNFKPKKLTVDTSDEDISDGSIDGDDSSFIVEKKERHSGRRTAASKVKYQFSDEDEKSDSDSDVSLHSNDGIDEPEMVQQRMSFNDSFVPENNKPTKPQNNLPTQSVKEEIEISDTDSEFEQKKSKPKPQPKKVEDQPTASQMFDSLVSPAKPEENAQKRKFDFDSDSDSGSDFGGSLANRVLGKKKPVAKVEPKKQVVKTEPKKQVPKTESKKPAAKVVAKKGPKKTAVAKRKYDSSGSSSDDLFDDVPTKQPSKPITLDDSDFIPRATIGRSKKSVKYAISDSEEDSDF